MICFPNAKINLGLNIVNKRSDGFHNIETIFYPIALCDSLEFVESNKLKLTITGHDIEGDIEKNLVVKAFRLLQQSYKLPELNIHLHKVIPSGAGLGGGSADAAFMLKLLNTSFKLGLSSSDLKAHAAILGSDCSFFIDNTPSFAHGRGEIIEKISLSLSQYHILLVKPNIHVSTAEAYGGVKPHVLSQSLKELINLPVNEWKNNIYNDFERNIFEKHPFISNLKEEMYQKGAVYASMSGSGSSVFGIFEQTPALSDKFDQCFVWKGKL